MDGKNLILYVKCALSLGVQVQNNRPASFYVMCYFIFHLISLLHF